MSSQGSGRKPTKALRLEASDLLRRNRLGLEAAALSRAHSISDTSDATPAYREGLRTAISIGLDYAIDLIEQGGQSDPSSTPSALLAQARMAARDGVSLETVFRRYFSIHSLLAEFLMKHTFGSQSIDNAALSELWPAYTTALDRLIAAVGQEYHREKDSRITSREARLLSQVKRHLRGEPVDVVEFNYDFDAKHVGAILVDPGAHETAQSLAATVDCRPLIVRADSTTVWAWFGSRRKLDVASILDSARRIASMSTLALGESADGCDGWRLSHRQAMAALTIAQRRDAPVMRYGEVALLASTRKDGVFMASLQQLYLVPLETGRDHGKAVIDTLRAYFAADQQISSTAAALKVSRPTVRNRLRRAEERLGRSVKSCAIELQIAIQLKEGG